MQAVIVEQRRREQAERERQRAQAARSCGGSETASHLS
jgi:hypothetical protein